MKIKLIFLTTILLACSNVLAFSHICFLNEIRANQNIRILTAEKLDTITEIQTLKAKSELGEYVLTIELKKYTTPMYAVKLSLNNIEILSTLARTQNPAGSFFYSEMYGYYSGTRVSVKCLL